MMPNDDKPPTNPMLWEHYVFRRGQAVHALWDDLFQSRSSDVVVIAGCGFDPRVNEVLTAFQQASVAGEYEFRRLRLVLIELSGYQLDEELIRQTEENCAALRGLFSSAEILSIGLVLTGAGGEIRSAHAIQKGVR